MLSNTENKGKIEGILLETDLKYGSYTKDGRTVDTIGGTITVQVDKEINGNPVSYQIPVSLYSQKYKKDGTLNPAYTSIETVMKDYKSVAAAGKEEADRIRITGAQIRMNEYYGQNGNLNSYPRINASFVTKITDLSKYNPEATFSAIFAIGSMGYETDKDGVEIPNRYKIRGIMPQYGGSVDVIDFFATSPNVIDAVSSYWEQGDTVKINGKLNFTSKTEEKMIEVDFGEPRIERKTISVSELIITGGSQTPLEGDFAFDMDEIHNALEDRQARLAELKAKQKAKESKTAPKTTAKKSMADLGF